MQRNNNHSISANQRKANFHQKVFFVVRMDSLSASLSGEPVRFSTNQNVSPLSGEPHDVNHPDCMINMHMNTACFHCNHNTGCFPVFSSMS